MHKNWTVQKSVSLLAPPVMHLQPSPLLLAVAILAVCMSAAADPVFNHQYSFQDSSALPTVLPCTAATCVGPVQAYFEYSNCTGDVVFYQLPWTYTPNECVNTSRTSDPNALALESHRYLVDGDDITLSLYWQNDLCLDSDVVYRKVSKYTYGVCVPTNFIDPVQGYARRNIAYGRPHMILRNVNVTIPLESALLTLPDAAPAYDPIEEFCSNVGEECVSSNSSKSHVGHYRVQYASDETTCPLESVQLAVATYGVHSDTCYALSGGYYKFLCNGNNGIVHHYYAGNGCQVWTGSISEHAACTYNYPGSYYSQYCVAHAAPEHEPSSANALANTSLLICFFALIGALVC